MISGKIEIAKIDKTKFYQGKKGLFLDFIMMDTPDSKYGDDYMIVQSVSKEDRDKGIRGAILGNAKIMGKKPGFGGGQAASQRRQPTEAEKANLTGGDNVEEDVPF